MDQEFNPELGYSAADAVPAERASYIRKTYLHLAAAILAFIGIEAFFFVSVLKKAKDVPRLLERLRAELGN